MSERTVEKRKSERGRLLRLEPHPKSFVNGEESAFISWAQSLTQPKAMDLFCGAGGLSLGLHAAGFEVIVGIDHYREALETHRANFPGLSVDWDLSDDDVVARVIDLGRASGVDLIAGGPPCQPFSKAGRSIIRELVRTGRRSANDHRRDLWESFVEVVDGIRPSAVLMENVPDMALDRDMQIIRTMVDLLEDMDYSVSVQVLDASRYEVPQFRQRLILVALANRKVFSWPNESGDQITLRNAIDDLPRVEGGWLQEVSAVGSATYGGPRSEFQRRARAGVPDEYRTMVFDHITRPVRKDDEIIFAAMDSTTKYSEIDFAVAALSRVDAAKGESAVGSLKRYRDDIFDDKYKRLDWNQLSRTITAHIAKDGYSYIHPEQERTLTIREAARIQTFPDEFRFAGPPSAALKQIGNAVPPRLGEFLGSQILRSIEEPSVSNSSTKETAKLLAAWFEKRDAERQLRFPWISVSSLGPDPSIRVARWRVIQGEILLGRIRQNAAKTVWPLMEALTSPDETQDNKTKIREISSWINRTDHAEKLLETAAWLSANPGSLDSLAGMNSVPNISGSTSAMAAHVAPGIDEDPVVTTAGILRVVARFFKTQVDRRNSGTDGRIALARMIGAEDGVSDHAYLALIEISEVVCGKSRPACNQCPLQERCATSL